MPRLPTDDVDLYSDVQCIVLKGCPRKLSQFLHCPTHFPVRIIDFSYPPSNCASSSIKTRPRNVQPLGYIEKLSYKSVHNAKLFHDYSSLLSIRQSVPSFLHRNYRLTERPNQASEMSSLSFILWLDRPLLIQ